jgi:hypothetical protein
VATSEKQPAVTSVSPRGSAWLVALVALLFLGGVVVSYVGITRPSLEMPPPIQPAPSPDAEVRIDLPHQEFPVPPGPHRERFLLSCTICHSPRLVFTQPLFPETKWKEVVHKMVAVYGAPFTPDDESQIVNYLTTVHGPTSP